MNNSTIYTADRITHLKVVVVGLLLATAVTAIAVGVRMSNPGPELFARQAPSVHVPATGFAGNGPAPMIR
ncbi:MAG: hypothetical protein AB7O50_12745 [Pseudolabrys sp.]